VIPWIHLDTAKVPGGGELKLMQRGDEFWIMAGTNPLMSSRMSTSEELLATVTCTPLATRPGARILIGGLGMGFTLREALRVLGKDASVVVAELVPGIISWAKGPLAPVFQGCLGDPRVDLRETDVGKAIETGKKSYDAILLDVDNGPDGLSRPSNDRLYTMAGLGKAKAALRPGGVLAVWSSGPDENFTKRLKSAGFAVEEVKSRAHGKRGIRHVVWLAKAPG
jgi:spermidine synthase